MATVTLQVGTNYATGDTVTVYAASDWDPAVPPSGAPPGSSVTTAVVAAAGTVTFTGLTENTDYFAYKSTGTPPYVRFRVDSQPGTGGDPILVGSAPTSTAPSTATSVAATTTSGAALASNSAAKWR